MLRVLFASLLCLLVLSGSASAQCITSIGWTAPHGTVRLAYDAGLPSTIQQGISDGIGAWNATSCNVGGNDFPTFSTAGTADATIQVVFDPGVNPSPGSCAQLINPSGNGTGAVLTLFGSQTLAEGKFPCFPNADLVSDTIAHELGHYLGLNNVPSSCGNHIMGPRRYTLNNGQISYETTRAVQSEECSAADENNSTVQEERQENPPPPDGGAVDPGPGGVDCCSSPFLIDLSGDGFALTSLAEGVRFDLDADGYYEQTAWTLSSDEVFLVLDRNGNGTVDDGMELFGNATPQPPSPAPNGFIALAAFDTPVEGGDGDGWITQEDQIFEKLLLWGDSNHDGLSQSGELSALEQAGIESIDLRYRESRRRDRHGNEFRFQSRVGMTGRRPFVRSVDVFFLVER